MSTKQIEHALLRAMLRPSDEADALVIADAIKPQWFTCDSTSEILQIIRDTTSTDLATIIAAAEGRPAFRVEGAKQFLSALVADQYGSIHKATEYIAQIAAAYETRERERLGRLIVQHAADAEKCQQLIASLEERVAVATIHQIAEGIHERLAEREKGDTSETVPCHLPAMNDQAPLRKGHVTVLAATTGLGKTTFALCAAKHAAEHEHGALIVSLEMKRDELCDRVLANEADVPLDEIQHFDQTTTHRQQILDAITPIEGLPLHVVDAFESTPAGVAAQCRKHMRKHPFEVLVVDYLQLLNANHPSGVRAQDVASNSRAMKNLATELDIAILLVSQFNRQAKDEAPKLWHLKESSAIEQDASLILMLHRPNPERANEVDVIIRKQRHGEQNFIVKSLFFADRCRFVEAAPQRYEAFAAYETTETGTP